MLAIILDLSSSLKLFGISGIGNCPPISMDWIILKEDFILFRVCGGGVFLGICGGCWELW